VHSLYVNILKTAKLQGVQDVVVYLYFRKFEKAIPYPLLILVIASRRRRRSNPPIGQEIAFPTLRSGHALRSQ